MTRDEALDGLLASLHTIERTVLVKHREKYHPMDWLARAEACGLITKEQAAACREAARRSVGRGAEVKRFLLFADEDSE